MMDEEARKTMGRSGREHVVNNYNFDTFNKTWVDLMTKIYEEHGSWETRGYKNYRFLEVA